MPQLVMARSNPSRVRDNKDFFMVDSINELSGKFVSSVHRWMTDEIIIQVFLLNIKGESS